jgi:spermidine synthase
MGLVWQKHYNDKHYEVRSAGKTRRLYTDGVFHSQFNPNRQLTGNVWDLLSLPSFFVPSDKIRRVLVLGVGGGAAMRQILNWHKQVELLGVELDETHIAIGKRFFGLQHKQIELIHADAIDYVKSYRGLPFDIIIEDLFSETNGEPHRVIDANTVWVKQLTRMLSRHGLLVMNFTEKSDFKQHAVFHKNEIQKRFKQAYQLTTPLYENHILALLQDPCTSVEWRKRILAHPQLAAEYEHSQSKVKLRKIRI